MMLIRKILGLEIPAMSTNLVSQVRLAHDLGHPHSVQSFGSERGNHMYEPAWRSLETPSWLPEPLGVNTCIYLK